MSKVKHGAPKERPRGLDARSPWRIPPKGWWQIAKRVLAQVDEDRLFVIAAGVALYWFLALFPILIVMFSLYGFIADPSQVQQQINSLAANLPASTQGFLEAQLSRLATYKPGTLGYGVLFGSLFAVWSSAQGMKALMHALNVVYSEKDTRNFLQFHLTGLGLTLLIIFMSLIALGTIIVMPIAFKLIGLTKFIEFLVQVIRWPILLALVLAVLGVLYRLAPSRTRAEWQWVSPGSVTAVTFWGIGSWIFSAFVQNFSNYSNTYGSLAAVIILILWFNLTAFIVLLGAEINAQAEYQTRKDSTIGEDKPMGQRGAFHADHVASGHSEDETVR